jgi:hypothetical protein
MLPAIKAAIHANELGNLTPYKLYFAKKGSSGASFGVFQNDTHENPAALATLTDILNSAGLPTDQVQRITNLVAQACPADPLTDGDEAAANAALASDAGMAKVDALDQSELNAVCRYLAQATAASANPISGEAQLAICMWCNMTGAPTKLLTWLGGSSVTLASGTVEPPGNPVSFDDMTRFLKDSTYFVQNPGNWQHFADSGTAGAALLPLSGV